MQSQGADTVRVFHHHFTVLTALACQHDDSDIVVVVLPALLQLRSVERLRFFAQYRRCIEIAGRIRTTRNRQVVAGHTRGRAVFIGIVQRIIDRETDILQRLIAPGQLGASFSFVFPMPLPPEVAKGTMVLPEKS